MARPPPRLWRQARRRQRQRQQPTPARRPASASAFPSLCHRCRHPSLHPPPPPPPPPQQQQRVRGRRKRRRSRRSELGRNQTLPSCRCVSCACPSGHAPAGLPVPQEWGRVGAGWCRAAGARPVTGGTLPRPVRGAWMLLLAVCTLPNRRLPAPPPRRLTPSHLACPSPPPPPRPRLCPCHSARLPPHTTPLFSASSLLSTGATSARQLKEPPRPACRRCVAEWRLGGVWSGVGGCGGCGARGEGRIQASSPCRWCAVGAGELLGWGICLLVETISSPPSVPGASSALFHALNLPKCPS